MTQITYDRAGNVKGNCDADLVLRVTQDYYEKKYDGAVIVSSDGDYSSLVKFLHEQGKLKQILSPAPEARCSILLKKTNAPITYLNQVRNLISYSSTRKKRKEKAPDADGTA
jgi:uncharacterized LabA/DUF88 family protein